MIVLVNNEKQINPEIVDLWVKHYEKQNLPFCIYSETTIENIDDKYITNDTSVLKEKNTILLTEYDFLFSYTKNEKDVMILSNDITDIEKEESIIGRVFHVPVSNKKKYTTFEIPDFILYQHENHTHFTVHGILIHKGTKPSKQFVCLSLKTSPHFIETEYYENDILFEIPKDESREEFVILCDNVYIKYAYNIHVNKEKCYGIIWHPKCACSTVRNYFSYVNNDNNINII
jgi:hypothetical protein